MLIAFLSIQDLFKLTVQAYPIERKVLNVSHGWLTLYINEKDYGYKFYNKKKENEWY